MKKIANSKESKKLLNIEEYYNDELCDCLAEELKIDFEKLKFKEKRKILSRKNLSILLNDNNISQRLKECLKLSLDSKEICRKLDKYIGKSKIYDTANNEEEFD